jgi:hypothetical protein
MAREKDALLDLRMYLAKARGGTTKEYRKKPDVFSQGSPAEAVFYLEKGKVKLTPLRAREGGGRTILGERFLGEGASRDSRFHGHGDPMTECSILRVQRNNGPDAPQ